MLSLRQPAALAPVLLVNFIGTLGYTIAIPFLVYLVTRLGGDAFVYGLLASTYSAFQFVAAPVLGQWSDQYGRRRILLLSQIGTLISWLVFALALYLPSATTLRLGAWQLSLPLGVLFVARALDGLTGGNISVANAYVADISTDANRSRNFGRMGVAANLGMVLGPALAGALGGTALKERLPVFAATAISLLGVLLILWLLPKSPARQAKLLGRQDGARLLGQETRDCRQAGTHSFRDQLRLLNQPAIRRVVLLNFVVMGAFSFFYTAFPIRAATDLSWSVAELGSYFAVLSLMLVGVQGPVLAWLAARLDERTLICVGLGLLAINFLLMQSASRPALYLAAAFFALGNGLMWPSLVALGAKVADKAMQGVVQGLAGSAGSLASIVGLIGGGLSFAAIGPWTFQVSMALCLVALALALRLPGAAAES